MYDIEMRTIEFEAQELECNADFRLRKAAEYPDDERNVEAAALSTKLAEQLSALDDGSSKQAAAFKALCDTVFADTTNESHEVARLWTEYRSRIGFDNFPESAEEYLKALSEIVQKVLAQYDD